MAQVMWTVKGQRMASQRAGSDMYWVGSWCTGYDGFAVWML